MAKAKECREGGETKTNGNCTRAMTAFPFSASASGSRTSNDYLRRYIDASRAARAKFLADDAGRRSGGAAFIDLFAGPGRARVQQTGELIDGSPLVALGQEEAPFTRVILCDLDRENVAALRQRTSRFGERIRIVEGDCNREIERIAREVPPYGLNIALYDPFAPSQWDFKAIERLANFARMDLILHYPTGPLKRNCNTAGKALEKILGKQAEQAGVARPEDIRRAMGVLRERLGAHGYTKASVRSMVVENTKGVPLYHLVFASKSKLGDHIWQSVTQINSRGQRSLGFDQ